MKDSVDFSTFNQAALENSLNQINREKYPENFRALNDEIEKRKAGGRWVEPSARDEIKQFWETVASHKAAFFLWFLCWPFAGISIIVAYEKVFGRDFPLIGGPILLTFWSIVWAKLGLRLLKAKCIKCGNHAFAHPLFFMKDARCQHCGFSREIVR